MKATILYYSHKGRTAGYAREMAMYLWSKGISVSLSSISDFDKSKLDQTDFLLLGCWTSGWFVLNQHPHARWKELAHAFSGAFPSNKILFFTTYKIVTGSMFDNMKRVMEIDKPTPVTQLKSRTGRLTENDKSLLNQYIGIV